MLKVNEYYNGKVKSIAFQGDLLPATVGVMEEGKYEFATDKLETVTVISGKLTVQLPNSDSWQDFIAGDTFQVAGGEKFHLQVDRQTAYLCTYE